MIMMRAGSLARGGIESSQARNRWPPRVIWKPVAGDGAVARPLLAAGFMVGWPRMPPIRAGCTIIGGLQTMGQGTFAGACGSDENAFAVGTSVTGRPPHRSGRAGFPHPAPTSGV